jgi:uncharacterized Zn-binding protein involved in type VI secretion
LLAVVDHQGQSQPSKSATPGGSQGHQWPALRRSAASSAAAEATNGPPREAGQPAVQQRRPPVARLGRQCSQQCSSGGHQWPATGGSAASSAAAEATNGPPREAVQPAVQQRGPPVARLGRQCSQQCSSRGHQWPASGGRAARSAAAAGGHRWHTAPRALGSPQWLKTGCAACQTAGQPAQLVQPCTRSTVPPIHTQPTLLYRPTPCSATKNHLVRPVTPTQ